MAISKRPAPLTQALLVQDGRPIEEKKHYVCIDDKIFVVKQDQVKEEKKDGAESKFTVTLNDSKEETPISSTDFFDSTSEINGTERLSVMKFKMALLLDNDTIMGATYSAEQKKTLQENVPIFLDNIIKDTAPFLLDSKAKETKRLDDVKPFITALYTAIKKPDTKNVDDLTNNFTSNFNKQDHWSRSKGIFFMIVGVLVAAASAAAAFFVGPEALAGVPVGLGGTLFAKRKMTPSKSGKALDPVEGVLEAKKGSTLTY